MDKGQKRWLYISLAFSVVIILIVLLSTFNEETISYLLHMNLIFLVIAIGLRFVSFSIWALRIQVMSASLNHHVSFTHCFNMVIANLLAGAITPGQAGGEPVRVHELYRAGMPVGDATAVVIMERFLDGIILIVLTVASLFIMWETIWQLGTAIVSVILLSLLFLIGFNLILIHAGKNPIGAKRLIMSLLSGLERRFPRPIISRIISSVDREYDNFSEGIVTFSSHGKKGFVLGGILSIFFWFSEFIIASIILMGLGLPPVIAESMIAQILIALVSLIPLTPGSSGIAEISAASFYALFVPTAALGVFILLWRLIMFYLNIVFGAIATMVIFKREIIRE
ncbi:MAG TPA: flippase-like domain-containing protein [Methanospirillum sp.]|nr:flippase-like domain-containing protein [Methanospirillum sp.]